MIIYCKIKYLSTSHSTVNNIVFYKVKIMIISTFHSNAHYTFCISNMICSTLHSKVYNTVFYIVNFIYISYMDNIFIE